MWTICNHNVTNISHICLDFWVQITFTKKTFQGLDFRGHLSQFEDIFYASVIYAYYHKMHIQSHARKTETSGVHFFILKISFSKRIKNVKNKKKLGKKGFTTQFRGQKKYGKQGYEYRKCN